MKMSNFIKKNGFKLALQTRLASLHSGAMFVNETMLSSSSSSLDEAGGGVDGGGAKSNRSEAGAGVGLCGFSLFDPS